MEWFWWFVFGFSVGGGVFYLLSALRSQGIFLR